MSGPDKHNSLQLSLDSKATIWAACTAGISTCPSNWALWCTSLSHHNSVTVAKLGVEGARGGAYPALRVCGGV